MVFRIIPIVLLVTIFFAHFCDSRVHSLRRHRQQEELETAADSSMSEELERSLGDEDERAPYVRHRRHELQEDSSQEQELRHRSSDRHRHHHHRGLGWSKRNHHTLNEDEADLDVAKEDDEAMLAARGKRHNRRRTWTEKDKKMFSSSRPRPEHLDSEKAYELEVREAQNSSLCNYTVIPIPDPGGRIPRDLEHVKCNHAGHKCQERGTYCCIQTYRNVEVVYQSGGSEILKVYSGCVCSLQIYSTLEPYAPELDLNS